MFPLRCDDDDSSDAALTSTLLSLTLLLLLLPLPLLLLSLSLPLLLLGAALIMLHAFFLPLRFSSCCSYYYALALSNCHYAPCPSPFSSPLPRYVVSNLQFHLARVRL